MHTDLKSRAIDGAQRKEILYGPYTVEPGKMFKTNSRDAESPCNDCYVTAMHATIKYSDGREALTSEGAWLHHTVLANRASSGRGGMIWAAGNERPTIRLNGKYKYGIDWPDSLGVSVDIMSEKNEQMTVSMSITYEYIEKESEMGQQYKASQMYWSQIGSPAPPPGKMTYKSRSWNSNVNAKLLYTIGSSDVHFLV
jgi:hypothetical protein